MAQGALYPIDHNNIDVFYAKYRYGYEFVGIKKFRGKLSRIRPRIIRPLIHEPRRYAAYNHLLDSIGLIDWNSDTVVIVSGDVDVDNFDLIKSKKGTICLYSLGYDMIDDDYYYGLRDFQEYLHMCGDTPCPPDMVKQDSIRSYALLSFDFDVISNVLKYSSSTVSDFYSNKYFVYRVAIKNGKIIDTKMLIVPKQWFWRSEPEDSPAQQATKQIEAEYKERAKKEERKLKNRIKAFFNRFNIFRDYNL